MARNNDGDPGTWEAARELGKQLIIPVGPYEPRVPTADEMNAVLPYLMDRAARHYERAYYCENAEVAFAHLLGINVPRQGFPRSDGFSRHNLDWAGFNRHGFDADGYDKDGYSRDGFNRQGLDKDGFDYRGLDKDGYNRDGRDINGDTREEAVAKQVAGWSDEYRAAIAAYVAKLKAQEPVAEGPQPEAPAKKVAPKKVAAKKVAPKKAPVKRVLAPA